MLGHLEAGRTGRFLGPPIDAPETLVIPERMPGIKDFGYIRAWSQKTTNTREKKKATYTLRQVSTRVKHSKK